MGMLVHVLRNSLGDCTANGVSSKVKSLCVVNVDGPFDPDETHPAVELVEGPNNTARLVPVADKEKWVMFGGNYATTSDSRFGKNTFEMFGYPIDAVKIFDRIEA